MTRYEAIVSEDLPDRRRLGRGTESRLEEALHQMDARVAESQQCQNTEVLFH